MTDDLVRFLTECLDRDSDAIRKSWNAGGVTSAKYHGTPFDPSRAMTEVDAKRRIISQHLPVGADPRVCLSYCHTRVPGQGQHWPCLTLRLMALPYCDHPDYNEGWQPGPLLTVSGADYQPE